MSTGNFLLLILVTFVIFAGTTGQWWNAVAI